MQMLTLVDCPNLTRERIHAHMTKAEDFDLKPLYDMILEIEIIKGCVGGISRGV